MGYMKYKGYTGSVEYSEEDNCLFGKVMGLSKDAITYEGQTVDELRQDFEGAINDYLESCAAHGVEPSRPPAAAWHTVYSVPVCSSLSDAKVCKINEDSAFYAD